MNNQDTIIQDRSNHMSLLDGAKYSMAHLERYVHNDMKSLTTCLAKPISGKKLIITDGVFSMNGDVANLPEIILQAKASAAWVMVDDAHGFGHIGQRGAGTLDYCGVDPKDIPIYIGTFSKSFATCGAFVAGSQDLIEALIYYSHPYLVSSTLSAASVEATRVALQLIRTETWRRDSLNNLISQFTKGVKQLGIQLHPSATAIQTLVIGDEEETVQASRELFSRGLCVMPISYPIVPKGRACLRMSLSVLHNEEHINRLLDALNVIKQKYLINTKLENFLRIVD